MATEKMNEAEMTAKLNELKDNPEFKEKLEKCESIDEVVSLFGEYGITVDAAELEAALEQIDEQMENGELSEDLLENVSGGCGVALAILVCVIALEFWRYRNQRYKTQRN